MAIIDSATLDSLADAVSRVRPKRGRKMIAVAGAPGAGKSTLSEALVAHLGLTAALVPMDGFHLDNAILDARGLRPRKGAPESFDAGGFAAAMKRLASGDEVILPVFDRERDVAIAGAREVSTGVEIAVVEGNYLLLDEMPWAALAELWDLTIYLDVPLAELERRLTQRWLDHNHSRDEARARVHANDLPNADRVVSQSRAADLIV